MADTHAPRHGRYAQAQRNDTAILDAAREVFVSEPNAPIAAVAKRAGVGIGALYSRYRSKEDLLATLCANGQQTYLAEVERALAVADPAAAYLGFLHRIVDADTHALTVRLAGAFTPTARHMADAERMQELGIRLFERAKNAGVLRADVTFLDVSYLLEAISTTKLGDPSRTAAQRRRHLAVLIDGLRAPGTTPLPGEPPTWAEQTARWVRQ